MKNWLVVPAMVGLVLMGACGDSGGDEGGGGGGSKAESPVGTWKIEWSDEKTKEFAAAAGAPEAMVKAAMPNTRCAFNDDKTCWIEMMGQKMSGKWTQDGETITIDPDKEEDKKDAPKIKIGGGKLHVEMTPPNGKTMHWSFARSN